MIVKMIVIIDHIIYLALSTYSEVDKEAEAEAEREIERDRKR